VMVLCCWTPTLKYFAIGHSGLLKLGHRTPRAGYRRLRTEKTLFWTSGVPKPHLGPPPTWSGWTHKNPSVAWLLTVSLSFLVSMIKAAMAGWHRRHKKANRGRLKMVTGLGASSSTSSHGAREAKPLCPFCRTATVVARTSRTQNNPDKQFYTCRNRDWVSYLHFLLVHFGIFKSDLGFIPMLCSSA